MLFRMNFHKHFNLIIKEGWEGGSVEEKWNDNGNDNNKTTQKSQQPDENFTCMVRNFTC